MYVTSSEKLRYVLPTMEFRNLFAKRRVWLVLVRPEFTGTLAIKSGRHPILEGVHAAGTLVPNDVYCSEASSFQIVQGPKSVVSLFHDFTIDKKFK